MPLQPLKWKAICLVLANNLSGLRIRSRRLRLRLRRLCHLFFLSPLISQSSKAKPKSEWIQVDPSVSNATLCLVVGLSVCLPC